MIDQFIHTHAHPHTPTQTHYPDFLRSSIYLRFLNELVHMLNAASLDSPKPHTATHRHLVSHADWRGDIDDPDTIWQRQHLPYLAIYTIHVIHIALTISVHCSVNFDFI